MAHEPAVLPRSSSPSLRWNLSWTMFGNVVFSAANWAIVVVLAKLGSTEMVGLYALGMAITQPVVAFARLELRAVQVTDVNAQFRFRSYLALRFLGLVFGNLIILALVLTSTNEKDAVFVTLLVSVIASLDAVSDIFHGELQRQEKMDSIAVALTSKGVLSLVFLWLGLWAFGNLEMALSAVVVARLTVLIAYEAFSVSWGQETIGKTSEGKATLVDARREDRWALPRLAWLALPVGVVVMLNSYAVNIPRYFVEDYFGKRELGIFAANSSLIMMGRLVIGALGQSASPRLARYYAAGNLSAFRSLITKLMGFGAVIGTFALLGGLLFGKIVLRLVYRPEYAENIEVFLFLLLAETFYYVAVALGVGMTASRHFKLQVPLSVLSVLVTVLFSYLLIPPFGVTGAALTSVATMATILIAHLLAFPFVLRGAPLASMK